MPVPDWEEDAAERLPLKPGQPNHGTKIQNEKVGKDSLGG